MKLKKSQLALGSYHYALDSVDTFLDSAARLGFGNVEIEGNRSHFWVSAETVDTARLLGEKIAGHGLGILCLCPGQNNFPYNISAARESYRLAAVEYMSRAVRLAGAMGCPTVLLCPGSGYITEDPADAFARCRSSIEALVPVAEAAGVRLALETQSTLESTHMNSVEQQRRMLDEVRSPALGAMIDTVQMAMYNAGDMAHVIDVLGDDLCHVHVGNTRLFDQFVQPGNERAFTPGMDSAGHIGFAEGELPLLAYLEELGRSGYDGSVTLEICSDGCWLEPERFAREALEAVLPAFE